ncbi:hypothetical protein JHK87_056318 [Glycine soja]|nr:hypothetical protein JHK87_056318 [Glycine soja]
MGGNRGSSGGGKGGGGGNSSKGGGGGGGGGGGSGGYMKAPGGDGAYISRGTFENNPQGYFSGLHAGEKGNK